MLEFPKDKIEWALFEGIEQEGPNKGRYTLFVVGDVPLDKILDKHRFAQYIYFGAGGRFDYNSETVREIARLSSCRFITIESPVYDLQLHEDSHSVWIIPYVWKGRSIIQGIVSLHSAASMKNVYGKIDTGSHIFIHSLDRMMINTIHSGYENDRLIVQKESKLCV